MADEYQCDECKQMTDTIYFYRPLCGKCYRKKKDQDEHDAAKGAFIPGLETLKKEAVHTDLEVKPS